MKSKKIWISLFLLTACANYPIKDFKTSLWIIDSIDGEICLYRYNDDDQLEWLCGDDADGYIGVNLELFRKEIKYQNTLINSCQKWKKTK